MSMNRIANAQNKFQGSYKKVLCVCSAGLLRSPTAAVVLAAAPFNFNTRAVGYVEEYALIALDAVHLFWADEIVVMEEKMAKHLKESLKEHNINTPVICLDIPDSFKYRDPELMELIKLRYQDPVRH